jgi:hypothetical protein
MSVAVLLDINVPALRCTKGSYKEFFDYLESHPFLGMVTERTLKVTKKIIKNLRDSDYKKAIYEFERLPTYLEVKNFKHSDTSKPYHEVNGFLFKLLNDNQKSFCIRPAMVCSRYRGLAMEINMNSGTLDEQEKQFLSQKIASSMPQKDDALIIAEAISLKECPIKFIVSEDRHLSQYFVSKEIEKRFEVKCRHPGKILPELRQYEHLFKEKVIL